MAAPGCNFSGHQDMYGLGIRIGFYCLWFGTVLASWVARGEFRLMKLTYFFFVGAIFLAVIFQTTKNTLLPVETYIVLLLAFGGYLNVVPLYLWKGFTWCEPRMDPSRYPRASTGRIFQLMNFTLMIALSVFQLWFWIRRVNAAASDGCVEFGFFFAQLQLNGKGFVVANILFHFSLLFTCIGVVGFILAKQYGLYEGRRHKRIGKRQKYSLQRLQAISDTIVASVLVTAIELLIRWNGIQGVNSVSTSGQTIPMIVGIGLVARVLYIGISGDVDNYDDDWSSSGYGSYYSGSKSSGPRSEDGGGPAPAAWPAPAPPPMAPAYGGGYPRPPPGGPPPPPPPPPPGH
ncbi:uncharacterized protein K444DRAFT_577322 [Hyaloscypha bicolor E]|uniref:Uncharacterized protein n=1 Tax=Hyaloscypha bicolor E TaxID=1095630 RepID=A0A2J6SFM7_9HELO|nr:uncharacterized protein K444DRAFT_577322 [Hyaloscypha bicolor E]PMD49578.1 hypothetical protein K444DRAFT_577322 [Hyaloscypha bicolor E]